MGEKKSEKIYIKSYTKHLIGNTWGYLQLQTSANNSKISCFALAEKI